MIPFPFFREFNVLSIENLKIILNFGPLQRMSRMTKHVSKAGKVNPHQGNHFTGVTLLLVNRPLIIMQSHHQNEFCANLMYHESDPGWAGYPTLNVYTAKFDPG